MKYIKKYEDNSPNPIGLVHSKVFSFIHSIFDLPFENYLEHNKFETEFKTSDKYHFTLQTEKKVDGHIYFKLKSSIAHFDFKETIEIVEYYFKSIFKFSILSLKDNLSNVEFLVENQKQLDKISKANFEKFKTTSKFDL